MANHACINLRMTSGLANRRTLGLDAHGGAQLLAGPAHAQAAVVGGEVVGADRAVAVGVGRRVLRRQEGIHVARLDGVLWPACVRG